MVTVVLITPESYYGAMMDIVKERRGTDITTQFLDDGQVMFKTVQYCPFLIGYIHLIEKKEKKKHHVTWCFVCIAPIS